VYPNNYSSGTEISNKNKAICKKLFTLFFQNNYFIFFKSCLLIRCIINKIYKLEKKKQQIEKGITTYFYEERRQQYNEVS
jgi:hypothetical protein